MLVRRILSWVQSIPLGVQFRWVSGLYGFKFCLVGPVFPLVGQILLGTHPRPNLLIGTRLVDPSSLVRIDALAWKLSMSGAPRPVRPGASLLSIVFQESAKPAMLKSIYTSAVSTKLRRVAIVAEVGEMLKRGWTHPTPGELGCSNLHLIVVRGK
jgi:hypothetical protein